MKNQSELAKILTKIDDLTVMDGFLKEMCTEKELRDLSLRWQLLKELYEGKTQRDIAKHHKISLCKITRGSKLLRQKDSVVRSILDNLND
jgi:TrpR family trp operon transcriptional repressor